MDEARGKPVVHEASGSTGAGAAGPPWPRRDRFLLAAALLLPLLHWRPGHRTAYSLDSALLALGVQDFDLTAYHPHPPYYPLTIAVARLLAQALPPTDALGTLALASTCAMTGTVFLLGRWLGGPWTGAAAAALCVASPLVAQNAAVPLSYASEGAASAVVACLAWAVRRRAGAMAWLALGVAAACAVALRPSAALYAAPLVLWATWGRWATFLRVAAAGAASALAVFLPAIAAGGGWDAFRHGLAYQSRVYILHDPVWHGGWGALANNAAWFAYHGGSELTYLALVSAIGLTAWVALRPRAPATLAFFVAWAAPSVAFHLLVYMGWPVFPSGYLMGLVPASMLAAAATLRWLWSVRRTPRASPGTRKALAAAVVVLAAVPLSWLPCVLEARAQQRDVDAWAGSWRGLEEALPPDRTALLGAYAGPWAQVEHPDYLAWVVELGVVGDDRVVRQLSACRGPRCSPTYFDNLRDGADDPWHPIPAWVQEIAIVEGHPLETRGTLLGVPADRVVELPGGARVQVLDASRLRFVEEAVRDFEAESRIETTRSWPTWDA